MSNERSNLIDVTYERIHAWLNGQYDTGPPSSIISYFTPRMKRIREVAHPFGTPSDASRDKIKSGTVTLDDGVTFQIEDVDKDLVLAISDKFHIDEVEAFILLRSFLYNEPSSAYAHAETSGTRSVIDEWIEAIIPFYYSQRLFILRVLPPLFRAIAGEHDPLFPVAQSILPSLIPDGRAFAMDLIDEYMRKCALDVPADLAADPRGSTRWAKQNCKEQLVLLEVLFWTVWDYTPCDGPLVSRVLELSYESKLGSVQSNSTLLLDEEAMQLLQDCAALWILITVEVLELEKIADPGGVLEISANPKSKDLYVSDPVALTKIHELVITHRNSQYAIAFLAWAYVLSKLFAAASPMKELPDGYRAFFNAVAQSQGSSLGASFAKAREPIYMRMAQTCLGPEVGLFKLMLQILTSSPLFVSSIAIKTGSSIITPNVVASRSVFKGLLIALLELVQVERIPDFDGLVEAWIALFGRSEARIIYGITRQFWEYDMHVGHNRRAILDVARARFPIHLRPLVRLLRSLSGAGFLDTDPLCVGQPDWQETDANETDESGYRDFCGRSVFYYFAALPTYSQAIPASACTGAHALYEKLPERYGDTNGSLGLTYVNLRPVKLPGGSTLPVRSAGKLLSDEDKDIIVVAWQHEHSGWKIILEVLTDYVNRRRMRSPSGQHRHQNVSFARRGTTQPITLRVEDVGIETGPLGDEIVITDALDLVRSVIQGNPLLAGELLSSLETGDHVVAHTMVEASPPDLVQLTTMILEETLSRDSRAHPHTLSSTSTQLITSAMGVLCALLDLPLYSDRVWLYIRSTAALFGSERSTSFALVALAAERVMGSYTMTLALLQLVQRLFVEASTNILYVQIHAASLQRVKEEVLLRAARFVHSEIWVEHLNWKYTQLGDRFVIGYRVMAFFSDVMAHVPPPEKTPKEKPPFVALCQAVTDVFLHKATSSTINPLVVSIAGGASLLKMLHGSRRYGDCKKLRQLLKSHLTMTRLVLNYKQRSSMASKPCLLEQALCARVSGGLASLDPRTKLDPVDVIAGYVKSKIVGDHVRHDAIRTLYSLCESLSMSQPSPLTIVGRLSDPEATMVSLVRILQHPFDDLSLRIAVWNFISLAMHKEPPLAGLLVAGHFRIPADVKRPDKAIEDKSAADTLIKSHRSSALEVATDMLATWKTLWDHNPPLLARVLRFLDIVWQHGLEHKGTLESIRGDAEFWSQLADIIKTELGPAPSYEMDSYVDLDGVRRANSHPSISFWAYRASAKSFALHLIGLDAEMQTSGDQKSGTRPLSFTKVEPHLKTTVQLTNLVMEAAANSCDPILHDELLQFVKAEFSYLDLEQLESQEPVIEREFGDDFSFSTALLQNRLFPFQNVQDMADQVEEVDKRLRSVNLNLSLAHSQISLVESLQFFFRQMIQFVRSDTTVRPIALSIAANLSSDIARETRGGDLMAKIHGARLSLLLSLLEVAWFSLADQPNEIKSFISLVRNVHDIIHNESQPPSKSVLGLVASPFHRMLLQIIYFCAKHCRNLSKRPRSLTAEQRLTVTAMLDASLSFAIDSLRAAFDSACVRVDAELDCDVQLLVAVFDQCTRPDIHPSSTSWLSRCIEADVIKSSLRLFVRTDLVGLSDLPFLLALKRPLCAPHILMFHMSLASIPAAAEKLASEGVLTAYTNNSISSAISAGLIDVTIPEFPGDCSPAHRAYCSMLAVVAGVVGALGRHNHFFDSEATAFVQFYSDQISRALSWTTVDTISLPLVEELDQIVNVFAAIATSTPAPANSYSSVSKLLRVFTTRGLMLLQQLNYALTHPNHLASLIDPVTADERALIEKGAQGRDPLKSPLALRVVERLFRLSGAILLVLVTVSRADCVLLGDREDWPIQEALLIPHSKVVLGEPASLGTLLELGNCTLDRLRDLSTESAQDKAKTSIARATARNLLELIMLYCITQLAMWLSKPEFDIAFGGGGGGDANDEESPGTENQKGEGVKDRKAPRTSLSLAERLRRGITGEMADDLESFLKKGRAALEDDLGPEASKHMNLSPILIHFFEEHLRS